MGWLRRCHVNLKVSHVTEKGESSGTESYSVQKRSSKIVTRVWHNDYKLTGHDHLLPAKLHNLLIVKLKAVSISRFNKLNIRQFITLVADYTWLRTNEHRSMHGITLNYSLYEKSSRVVEGVLCVEPFLTFLTFYHFFLMFFRARMRLSFFLLFK